MMSSDVIERLLMMAASAASVPQPPRKDDRKLTANAFALTAARLKGTFPGTLGPPPHRAAAPLLGPRWVRRLDSKLRESRRQRGAVLKDPENPEFRLAGQV